MARKQTRDGRQQEGLGVLLQEDEERRPTSGSAAGVSNHPAALSHCFIRSLCFSFSLLQPSRALGQPCCVASISGPGAETWKEGLEERRGMEKAKMLEAGKENIS